MTWQHRGPSAPVLMLCSALLFSLMAVCVKWAAAHYDAGEMVFYRSPIGVLFITALARARGTSLRTAIPAMHFWRSASSTRRAWICLAFHESSVAQCVGEPLR